MKDEAIEPLRLALLRAVEHVRLVKENARLMGELQSLNTKLEARVRERTSALELANARLLADRGQLEATLARLNETQEQLVQLEKMASIGLLTAGIAHEINNPLAVILPKLEQAEAWLAAAREGKAPECLRSLDDLGRVLGECRRGLDRLARLVRQLRILRRMLADRHDVLTFSDPNDAAIESVSVPRE